MEEAPAWLGLGLDGDGVAMTGGPTKLEEAPAWMGLGLETGTTGTTVLWAGQFSTVGAQLVMISLTVLKAVASAAGTGAAGAETCS